MIVLLKAISLWLFSGRLFQMTKTKRKKSCIIESLAIHLGLLRVFLKKSKSIVCFFFSKSEKFSFANGLSSCFEFFMRRKFKPSLINKKMCITEAFKIVLIKIDCNCLKASLDFLLTGFCY